MWVSLQQGREQYQNSDAAEDVVLLVLFSLETEEETDYARRGKGNAGVEHDLHGFAGGYAVKGRGEDYAGNENEAEQSCKLTELSGDGLLTGCHNELGLCLGEEGQLGCFRKKQFLLISHIL